MRERVLEIHDFRAQLMRHIEHCPKCRKALWELFPEAERDPALLEQMASPTKGVD